MSSLIFKRHAPTKEELQKILEKEINVRKLLNTSGILYRRLNLKDRIHKMEISEILSLLSNEGMLVKRPFVVTDDFALAGFQEKEWEKYFPN